MVIFIITTTNISEYVKEKISPKKQGKLNDISHLRQIDNNNYDGYYKFVT